MLLQQKGGGGGAGGGIGAGAGGGGGGGSVEAERKALEVRSRNETRHSMEQGVGITYMLPSGNLT